MAARTCQGEVKEKNYRLNDHREVYSLYDQWQIAITLQLTHSKYLAKYLDMYRFINYRTKPNASPRQYTKYEMSEP